MREKKTNTPTFVSSFFKNFILAIFIILFFLFIATKHSFQLDFKETKEQVATTIFSAKKINLYAEENKKFKAYVSSQNLNFFYEKNETKSINFEGKTKVNWEEKKYSYKIHSHTVNVLWNLPGKNKHLNIATFSQAELTGNVKIFSDSALLKTKQAFFFPKENLFTSNLSSKFLSEYGYLESKNGFKWDLGKKIFLINKGFDGISYEKK